MSTQRIPFEIHLTVADLPASCIHLFAEVCAQSGGKPLLIELAQGQYTQQPMFSRIVYANNLDTVFVRASDYSHSLGTNGFQVNRVKIEIPAFCAQFVQEDTQSVTERYFEWHGKIELNRAKQLLELCSAHRVHLSRNSLQGEATTRFITLREFATQEVFAQRIEALVGALEQGGWTLQKQQAEYCLYDSNTGLDQGWLPKTN